MIRFKDALEKAIDWLEEQHKAKSGIIGLPTGFSDLDELTSGLKSKELIFIGARPGMGKKSLAFNIVTNVAAMTKKPIAIFSTGMSDQAVALRLMSSLESINLMDLRKAEAEGKIRCQLAHSISKYSNWPIFIDDREWISTKEILLQCCRLRSVEGCLGLVVVADLRSVCLRSENGLSYMDVDLPVVCNRIKAIAEELKVPILVLADLGREIENREDHRPRLPDLFNLGIVNEVDTVLLLYRHEYYYPEEMEDRGRADLIVAKNLAGPTGTIQLAFEKQYMRYRNFVREEQIDGCRS